MAWRSCWSPWPLTHINVIFVDTICATGKEGINFSYPTIVWSTAGALPCRVFDPDTGTAADIDTSKTSDSLSTEEWIPVTLQNRTLGGCPLVETKVVSNTDETTSSDTDLDAHIVADPQA